MRDFPIFAADQHVVAAADVPLLLPRGQVARDYNDIANAAAVLCNLSGAESVSIGTVSECAWAWQLRKPLVLVLEAGNPLNPHDNQFLLELCPFRVETLDDGIDVVRSVLNIDCPNGYTMWSEAEENDAHPSR